jgi:glutamyl-tRNA reductase
MPLAVVGVSHHTAPVEVRERFAYLEDEVTRALQGLRAASGVEEAVLLSTCNRTEVYLYPVLDPEAVESATRMLAEKAGPLSRPASAYLYAHEDLDAVRHLFRVASGLDSLIMGEAEIQGQVRDAYHRVSSMDATPPFAGPVLNRLFQTALSVGGRVRSDTALGEGAASVASVAVQLAKKVFGSLGERRVMVLGAGSTAELVVDALRREGATDVVVVNRTEERASDLAQRLQGRALRLQDLSAALRDVDIVLTSTAAPHAVLRPATFHEAFPNGPSRPLLIVDIAIPRDVDPVLGQEPNVFLYNIDDMRRLVDETLERRREAVVAAEAIVSDHARQFLDWYASLEVVPVIRALREQGDRARSVELERLLSRLPLGSDEREAVADFSQRLLNKFLHQPTVRLREGAANGRAAELIKALRYLYGLDDSNDRVPDGPITSEADE